MKRVGLLVVMAVAVATAPASAHAHTRIVSPGGSVAQPYQYWINHAKIPTPNATMVLHRGRCLDNPEDKAGGCVVPFGADQTAPFHVWLWDTPDALHRLAGDTGDRGDLYHEVGHVFLYTLPLAVRERLVWKIEAYLHISVPEGDGEEAAAEAFKFCAKSPRDEPLDWFQNFGYEPSIWQHRKVCRAIVGASRGAGVR